MAAFSQAPLGCDVSAPTSVCSRVCSVAIGVATPHSLYASIPLRYGSGTPLCSRTHYDRRCVLSPCSRGPGDSLPRVIGSECHPCPGFTLLRIPRPARANTHDMILSKWQSRSRATTLIRGYSIKMITSSVTMANSRTLCHCEAKACWGRSNLESIFAAPLPRLLCRWPSPQRHASRFSWQWCRALFL